MTIHIEDRDYPPLAYISFSISGETLEPEFWTSYFNTTPKIGYKKGDKFTTSSNRTIVRPTGVWSFSSEPFVKRDLLTPHFYYLIEKLNLTRHDLKVKLNEQNVRARFFCYWRNENGDRIPDIPGSVKILADNINCEIDIDEYR